MNLLLGRSITVHCNFLVVIGIWFLQNQEQFFGGYSNQVYSHYLYHHMVPNLTQSFLWTLVLQRSSVPQCLVHQVPITNIVVGSYNRIYMLDWSK